ncbi:hypothetical protein ACIRD6_13425 [Streptomyces sp. NPDC102473]|uniref:hypothetical protein n=1 Tax=Streptomyces sp. NPDC102473 TaxID=3366180 RepID=UPI003823CA27
MTTETPGAVLRDHVADALADADGWEWAPGFDKRRSPSYLEFQRQADAVLAVLPADALAVARRILGTTEQADTETAPTVNRAGTLRARFEALAAEWEKRGEYGDSSITDRAREIRAVLAAEAQQPTPAPADADGCWCGHPQDRHFTSQSMTLPNGCHDCQGWNGAHAYGQDLPWAATPAPAKETTPCGNTQGLGTTNPYKPCARPAGHPEAYCKDATGDHLFLPATATPAPAEETKQ